MRGKFSRKKTSFSKFSGMIRFLLSVRIFPAVENKRSTSTEVGGRSGHFYRTEPNRTFIPKSGRNRTEPNRTTRFGRPLVVGLKSLPLAQVGNDGLSALKYHLTRSLLVVSHCHQDCYILNIKAHMVSQISWPLQSIPD